MSVAGKWRIVEIPGYAADYPDMVVSAYILFENHGAGEFAFGCCTGHIWEASNANASSIPSLEMKAMKWTRCAAMAPLNSNQTAHFTAKYATVMATKSMSSPKNGLLQRPVRKATRIAGRR